MRTHTFQICGSEIEVDRVPIHLRILQEGSSSFKSKFIQQKPLRVFTSYNSKSYLIDEISLQMNPELHKFSLPDGKIVSMADYFVTKYGIKLEEHQPLLQVKSST
jgi:hypothetical protein